MRQSSVPLRRRKRFYCLNNIVISYDIHQVLVPTWYDLKDNLGLVNVVYLWNLIPFFKFYNIWKKSCIIYPTNIWEINVAKRIPKFSTTFLKANTRYVHKIRIFFTHAHMKLIDFGYCFWKDREVQIVFWFRHNL